MSPKDTKQAKLESLLKHLKTADLGGGSKGWANLKVGRNTMRILPGVGDMAFFYQPVGVHKFDSTGKNKVYCPRFTTEGQRECPICEIVKQLWSGDKSSKALAKQLGVQKKFWMNAVNRDDEDAGPVILVAGPQIFDGIVNLVNDPDFADIYDPDHGVDIVIKRTGEGKETHYTVQGRMGHTPLSDDADKQQEWLDAAKDLTVVELSDDPDEDAEVKEGRMVWVLPYDRIISEYNLEDTQALFDNLQSKDDDEEEEEQPKSKPARKPVSKKAVEEEDEEDVEEEEVDEPPAKKEVARRLLARKSLRH